MSDHKYRQLFVPMHMLDFSGDDGGTREAEVTGYGCADVEHLPPMPPLHERVDLEAIASWTAENKAARDDYYREPNHFGWWKR